MSSESFSEAELRQAVSEIDTWGVGSARIVERETRAATCELVLLEGTRVTVQCSETGWRISHSAGNIQEAGSTRKSYETLDDLLLAVSPMFEAKRMEKLFERLSNVANERSTRRRDDDHDDDSSEDPECSYGEWDRPR